MRRKYKLSMLEILVISILVGLGAQFFALGPKGFVMWILSLF